MKDSGAAKQMQPELRRQVVGSPAPRSRWNNDTPAAAEVQANHLREKQRCQATNRNPTSAVPMRALRKETFPPPLLPYQSVCGLAADKTQSLARATGRRGRERRAN